MTPLRREDPLIRRLQVVAAMLARIVGFRSSGQIDEARAELEKAYGSLLGSSGDLIRREPPYKAGTETLRAVWHGRDEHDAGHAWLREMVAKTARVAEEALG